MSHAEQPEPTLSELPAVWDEVMRSMVARDRIGLERYKTRLQPFNGRDPLRDLLEELLDASAYLTQLRTELISLGDDLNAAYAGLLACPLPPAAAEALRLLDSARTRCRFLHDPKSR